MGKTISAATLALLVAIATLSGAAADDGPPGIKESPPGQVTVVTVNARQYPILGIKRFRSMYQLARALRRRPLAFDGGFFGAVQAPDVIVLQEIRFSNAEIFEHILRQRFGVRYQIVTPADAAATIIANPVTVSLVGDVIPLTDACSTPVDDRYPTRQYPIARFLENETQTAFAVVGVHFPKSGGPTSDCLSRNVEQMRTLFEVEQTPTIVAGDFNRRPVHDPFECDPDERSEGLPWWHALTKPDNGGRQYLDAVREHNRSHGISMSYEWTHEQKTKKAACTGALHHRRSRIDYIFVADGAVAEAHADHPGWGGDEPGTRNPGTFKYSDHRWVWARIVLSGPARPERPLAKPLEGGEIEVTWKPIDGVAEWVVYRAIGERAFGVVDRLPPQTTTYVDDETDHGRSYRYAIAGRTADAGQGVESYGEDAIADARGPQVVAAYPLPGATGVGPGQAISVRFDENVIPESVGQDSIRLFVNGHSVRGFVIHKAPRIIKFNPSRPLKKGSRYTAVVAYGLTDRLGNESSRFVWHFRTYAPPKKGRR